MIPMKDRDAASRRAAVVAKRTGVEQVVIPHPTVPDRFAFVPVDSPLATSAAPTAQAEGLDTTGLFQTQAPIPLKNARNLAGMMSMAGGVEHAVVPAPTGDGFGVVPADQLRLPSVTHGRAFNLARGVEWPDARPARWPLHRQRQRRAPWRARPAARPFRKGRRTLAPNSPR